MHKETVILLCCHAPIVRSNESAACAVDCLAVNLHPLAYLLQTLHSHLWQTAVGLRADIHKQVGVAAGCVHEIMNESLCRLVVLVCNLVAPHAVHCLAGLKRQLADSLTRQACGVLARQVALEHLEVLAVERLRVVVIADKARRLQLMYERILLGQAPVERRVDILIPPAVEPDSVHLAIVGEQLCELVVHELIVAIPVLRLFRSAGAETGASERSILASPVDVRVVEVQTDALTMTLVCQLLHDIALERRSVNDVII